MGFYKFVNVKRLVFIGDRVGVGVVMKKCRFIWFGEN